MICFKEEAILERLWAAEDGVGEHMVGPGVLPSPDGIVFTVSCCFGCLVVVWLVDFLMLILAG